MSPFRSNWRRIQINYGVSLKRQWVGPNAIFLMLAHIRDFNMYGVASLKPRWVSSSFEVKHSIRSVIPIRTHRAFLHFHHWRNALQSAGLCCEGLWDCCAKPLGVGCRGCLLPWWWSGLMFHPADPSPPRRAGWTLTTHLGHTSWLLCHSLPLLPSTSLCSGRYTATCFSGVSNRTVRTRIGFQVHFDLKKAVYLNPNSRNGKS